MTVSVMITTGMPYLPHGSDMVSGAGAMATRSGRGGRARGETAKSGGPDAPLTRGARTGGISGGASAQCQLASAAGTSFA